MPLNWRSRSWPRQTSRRPWLTRLLPILLAMVVATIPVAAPAQEVPELQITSTHYIVIDADTGEVFAQRRAHESVPIASLTKIFTTIEALESASVDTEITTTEADLVGLDATYMGFGPGETFSVKDLIYGMLLPSGNDAAQALARSLGAEPGDSEQQAVDRFLARINQRVRDMGLTETTLVNPDGWGVPGHVSSAHDLATFTMYALHYPRFVEAISTSRYETASGGYVLTNTNKMLEQYEGLIGGKTGYDDDAGYCLVEVAERDGSTMISVTLDGVAPDDWYDDNRVLLDYAFAEKVARTERGAEISGERLSYLDPDAAVIVRSAAAGASLGAPVTLSGTDDAGIAGQSQVQVTAPGGRLIASDDQSARRLWTALTIALVVILGGSVASYRRASVGFARPPTGGRSIAPAPVADTPPPRAASEVQVVTSEISPRPAEATSSVR
ncbi:MAG: D-alanyl-D-alanine carboxypeptidase [Chloroflexota bacterium]|nr:D-alanyl-D-alanine carboxypeptidase [Chloroflexota bacterium]